jgi:hypothetical protein
MANQPIPASNPSTIAATWDKWAFQIGSRGDGLLSYGAQTGPQPPIQFTAIGSKFRVRDDGCQERSPLPGDIVALVIPDLYAAAAAKPYVAAALAGLLSAIVQYGTETGQL